MCNVLFLLLTKRLIRCADNLNMSSNRLAPIKGTHKQKNSSESKLRISNSTAAKKDAHNIEGKTKKKKESKPEKINIKKTKKEKKTVASSDDDEDDEADKVTVVVEQVVVMNNVFIGEQNTDKDESKTDGRNNNILLTSIHTLWIWKNKGG